MSSTSSISGPTRHGECPTILLNGRGELRVRTHPAGPRATWRSGVSGVVQRAAERHPETRTTGLDGKSCRRCGEPVKGRRRNGYCSDRCRMRDRRENQAARVNGLLTTIEESVVALRRELEGHSESS
jgi:hypothetical protein